VTAPEVRITYSGQHRYALVQVGDRALTCHLVGGLVEVRYAARDGQQSGLVIVPLMPDTVSWLDPEIRTALAPHISEIARGVGATAHHALRLRRMLGG
jgi:hypothetical protein